MTTEPALPAHEISAATSDDLPFIRDTVARLRLDGERLEPQQFVVVRREGAGITAFGRIKPYRETYELGCVAVVEGERGRGWGELVVRELINRFPQDEVFVTTDLPEYFERLGFLRTELLPPELEEKMARVEGVVRSGVVGMRYVHHVNAPDLMAGVATVSLEIVEDLPDVDAIIAPIGGGSGAIGHCIVAKALRPGVQVIGVQAEGAPAVYRSWKERRLQNAPIDTIAEGLATGTPFFTPVRTFIDQLDDMLLVSDDEMRDAIALLLRSARQLAEPSGAASTAAALKLAERLKGKKVALVIRGGNLPNEELRRILIGREG